MKTARIECPHCDQLAANALNEQQQMALARARRLRQQADRYISGAKLCFALAAVAGLLGALGGAPVFFLLAGDGVGLAFFLYLIAQVIHIRANTEK